ncbi:DUF4388 domain-containing protein [Thermodesulfobacteriota bacterium]
MDDSPNSVRVYLSHLLLKLHQDHATGIVSVKDNRRAMKVYIKEGHIVFADGIDADSKLIKQIASKKNLAQSQLEELSGIKEKDPQSLGKILIEKKLITQSLWEKFLELKVKQVLSAAILMENADIGYSDSALSILPINFIDYNLIQLLLDTLRGIKNIDRLEQRIEGDDAVFGVSADAEELETNIQLSPFELSLYSLIDGRRTVEEIVSTSELDREAALRIFHLLLCLGLVEPGTLKKDEGQVNYAEIINLYLDLLRIIETNFMKEVGKEFENIFNECRGQLTGESKDILTGLNLSREQQEDFARETNRRLVSRGKGSEDKLLLLSAFNKLVFLLIMRMNKFMGVGLTEKTLGEMMNILEYVEKYREDAEMMNYVKGNLQDYLQQIKS